MITGQSPTLRWKPNPDGQVRTMEEATEIAKRWGIDISGDVVFNIDDEEYPTLDANTTAHGPSVARGVRERVVWSDFVHKFTGKVPFVIRPDILRSDEAIVAVYAHEMHELSWLRPRLQADGMPFTAFLEHTSPGRTGNLHDEAWDVADALVERMRLEAKR
jgi:hypothetical protein